MSLVFIVRCSLFRRRAQFPDLLHDNGAYQGRVSPVSQGDSGQVMAMVQVFWCNLFRFGLAVLALRDAELSEGDAPHLGPLALMPSETWTREHERVAIWALTVGAECSETLCVCSVCTPTFPEETTGLDPFSWELRCCNTSVEHSFAPVTSPPLSPPCWFPYPAPLSNVIGTII